MIRVPGYQRQVDRAGSGATPSRVNVGGDTGLDAVQRGYASLGNAADATIASQKRDDEKYQREMEQYQHQADVTAARNAATQLESFDTSLLHGDSAGAPTSGTKLSDVGEQGAGAADLGEAGPAPTERSPGYLSTRGMNAPAQSASTFEALQKRREELASSLQNDRQRELFGQHADQVLLNSRKTIESHAAQQIEVAKDDSINAAADEAVRAAAVEPGNDNLARERIAGVVGPIHAMGRGQEWADAKALEVEQRVAGVRVDGLLARGDVEGAGRVIEANKWALGSHLDDYRRRLAEAQKAASAGQLDAWADHAAGLIASEAVNPITGAIDQAKALESLSEKQLTDEQRVKVAAKLDHRFLVNDKAVKQRVDETYRSAFSVYLKTHNLDAVPPQTSQWLQDNYPEKWAELVDRQSRDMDRARRLLRGEHGEGETPSERRALVALEADIVRNPDKYAEMSPGAFDSEWGSKLSPSGYKKGGALFAGAAKGDRVSDGEFSSYVNEVARTSPVLVVGPHDDKGLVRNKKALADGLRADFGEARRAFKEEHKRNPTMSEVQSPEFQKNVYLNLLKRSGVRDPTAAESPQAEPFELDVKPKFGDRVKQLRDAKKTKDQARAILRAEGYTEVK